MRRLLFALLLLALPTPAWAVPAFVEFNASFGQTSSSSPFNFALFTAGVTPSGALLTCAIRVNTTGRTVTFSDSQSNTWVAGPSTTYNGGGDEFFTFYALNATMPGSSTLQIQAAVSGAGVFVRGACMSHSGIATASALDQTNFATGTGTVANAGSVTTTCANEAIVLYVSDLAGGAPGTAGGGFTEQGSSETDIDAFDRVVSATGTYTGTGTYAGSGAWAAITMSFADTTAPCSSATNNKPRGSIL